jgi:DNA-binding IclR family transcriptional regulator
MIQVIDRAFEIIGFVASSGTVSLSDIAKHCKLPLSTVARITSSLEHHGVLERSSHRAFRLGGRLLTLASQVVPVRSLVEIARPFMLKLSSKTNEDVGLSILQGEEAVIVDWVYGDHAVKVIEPFTPSITLNCAFRKVLLAHKRQEWIDNYISGTEFPKYTPHTIVGKQKIHSEINSVREQGYAVSRSENIMDAASVAGPVFDKNGVLAATVFLTAPISRFERNDLREMISDVVSTARTMTVALRNSEMTI